MAQDQPAGWIYSQSTGEMTLDGQHVATGYSGAGPGRNNPAMQASQGQGPIPQGSYSVGTAHQGTHTGPATLNLDAQPGTNTYGRDLFRVHGDSIRHPGEASEGCIIMPPAVRAQMSTSSSRTLRVVP
jgi:hypothetical protein